MIKKITKYDGKIFFNKKYPDGVKRRQIDSSSIKKLGWKANFTMKKGLTKYCEYYIKEVMPLEK